MISAEVKELARLFGKLVSGSTVGIIAFVVAMVGLNSSSLIVTVSCTVAAIRLFSDAIRIMDNS